MSGVADKREETSGPNGAQQLKMALENLADAERRLDRLSAYVQRAWGCTEHQADSERMYRRLAARVRRLVDDIDCARMHAEGALAATEGAGVQH